MRAGVASQLHLAVVGSGPNEPRFRADGARAGIVSAVSAPVPSFVMPPVIR